MLKKIGSSFLLLEMLVALTLVLLCIVPFIKVPSRAVRNELLSIERLELQHISDRAFAEIKERIYRQDISWEQLCQPLKKKTLVRQEEVSFPYKELKNKKCEMRCYLYSTGKKGDKEQEYRLVTVRVHFTRAKDKLSKFTYKLIVKSALKSSQAPH